MKKSTRVLLLSSVLLVPASAFAADDENPGFYVGGGYSMVEYDDSAMTDDAELGALFLRGGYQVNQNLAFEARVGTGIADDKVKDGSDKVKLEADYMYGAYLKAGVPTSLGLYPYMLVGWTETKLKASVPGDSVTDKSGGVSYGVGVEYNFNSQISAGLEYAKLYNNDDYKINGLTLGVNYKF